MGWSTIREEIFDPGVCVRCLVGLRIDAVVLGHWNAHYYEPEGQEWKVTKA